MIQKVEELPHFEAVHTLYIDLETTSLDYRETSLNPWDVDHCRIHCLVIAVDDSDVYAVPRECIELDWLEDLLDRSTQWVNQNVKYDAHVLANDLGMSYDKPKICTLALAHIYDSDRTFKGGYSLEALAEGLLGKDIMYYKKRLAPYLNKNKDYGQVPIDILSDYGCMDIITVRELYAFLKERLDEGDDSIAEVEQGLTDLLFELEQEGLIVDKRQLKVNLLKDLGKQHAIQRKLEEYIGYECNPQSIDDCFDLLCNRFGLTPVYDEESKNPTFSKHILAQYRKLPKAPTEVIDLVSDYRDASIHVGLFWRPWLELSFDGKIHASFRQNVRSGRMACKMPNLQQLDKRAKMCVKPPEGYAFITRDYSQIEYRVIAHYMEDPVIIKKYQDDPDTDYHTLVSEMAGIERRPAKTLNFAIAFGAGKDKTTSQLMIDPSIAAEGLSKGQIAHRAEEVYEDYHKMMPNLRRKARKAARIARAHGHIRNLYGRRLVLPSNRAHIAFNRVVQSTAADMMKFTAVNCFKDETARRRGWKLLCLVHDDFLFCVPEADVEEASEHFAKILHEPGIPFSVPVLSSCSWSLESWGHCA